MQIEAPPIRQEQPPLRVLNGVVLVGDTRVPIDSVINEFLNGGTPQQIVEGFDVLTLPEVYGVIAYYLRHRDEVDRYLAQRQAESDALRQTITSDPAHCEQVEKLRARGQEMGLRP